MIYHTYTEFLEARRREAQYARESAQQTLLDLATKPTPPDRLAAALRGLRIALALAVRAVVPEDGNTPPKPTTPRRFPMSEEEEIRERLAAWADGEGYCGGYAHDAEEGFAADLRFLLGLLEQARERIAALEAARRLEGARTGTRTVIHPPLAGIRPGESVFVVPSGNVEIDADTAPDIETENSDEEHLDAGAVTRPSSRRTTITVTGRVTITTDGDYQACSPSLADALLKAPHSPIANLDTNMKETS